MIFRFVGGRHPRRASGRNKPAVYFFCEGSSCECLLRGVAADFALALRRSYSSSETGTPGAGAERSRCRTP